MKNSIFSNEIINSSTISKSVQIKNIEYIYKRKLFSFFTPTYWKIKKISKLAEENPLDATKQYMLLKVNNINKYINKYDQELNRNGKPLEVTRRFESGKYAINEECQKEYLKVKKLLYKYV